MSVPGKLLTSLFPDLACDDEGLKRILDRSTTVLVEPGQTIFEVGSECRQFLMILEGSVKVELISLNGRSVTLYRIHPGGTCVLTTSCLLGNDDYPAVAVSERNVTALAISKQDFEHGLAASPKFRRWVFASFAERLAAVIRRMERVTLAPVDMRLAEEILRRAEGRNSICVTHEALADEIGSAREVVSRRLKAMQSSGLVELRRGIVHIVDPDRLDRLGH